ALDQSDVAVTDVFVNHRVAFHSQRINSIGPHASQQKTWHADLFDVLNGVDRSAGSDAADERHFADGVSRSFIKFHSDSEDRTVAPFQQASLLERRNVLRDGGLRTNAEVSGYLRVRWFVTVLG